MSAEIYITFTDTPKYMKMKTELMKLPSSLATYAKTVGFYEVWLKSSILNNNTWGYDLKIIFLPTSILLEIIVSMEDVRNDVKVFLSKTRLQLDAQVVDEDGEFFDSFN
jgi:hypothetical protein